MADEDQTIYLPTIHVGDEPDLVGTPREGEFKVAGKFPLVIEEPESSKPAPSVISPSTPPTLTPTPTPTPTGKFPLTVEAAPTPEKPRTWSQLAGIGEDYSPLAALYHGAIPFGMSDYGRGYIRDVVRGYPWGEGVRQIAKAREKYEAERPGENFAMNVAGGLAMPIPALGAAVKTVGNVTNPIIRGAAQAGVGAGTGGLLVGGQQYMDTRVLHPDEALERGLLGGALGAGVGGIAGLVVPPIAGGVASGARYIRPALNPSGNRVAGRQLAGTTGEVFPVGANVDDVGTALNAAHADITQAQKTFDDSLSAITKSTPGASAPKMGLEASLGKTFIDSLNKGPVTQEAVNNFIAQQGSRLDQHPELLQKLQNAVNAQGNIDVQQTAFMANRANFEKTIAGKIIGGGDIQKQVGDVYTSANPTVEMGRLFKGMRGNADGEAGLARAIAQDLSTRADIIDSQTGRLNTAGLSKFITDNRRTLEAGLSPEGMKTLDALAKGFGDSAKGRMTNFFSYIIPTAVGVGATGGIGTAAKIADLLVSGQISAAMAASMGVPGVAIGIGANALRARGLNNAEAVLARVLTDPELGRLLAMRATPANRVAFQNGMQRWARRSNQPTTRVEPTMEGSPRLNVPLVGPITPPSTRIEPTIFPPS